jgi:hypothetical protein
LLNSSEDGKAGLADTVVHELLAELTDTVMMANASTVLHNLLSSTILDVTVDRHGVR